MYFLWSLLRCLHGPERFPGKRGPETFQECIWPGNGTKRKCEIQSFVFSVYALQRCTVHQRMPECLSEKRPRNESYSLWYHQLYWLPQLRDGMSLWYSFFWRKWQDDQMRWLLCKSPSWNASGLRKSLSCKGITVSGYRSGRASDSTGTFFKDDKCGNAEAAGVRNFNSTAKWCCRELDETIRFPVVLLL